MYLGSVSVVGAVLLCIMTQRWSVPSASSEWVLLVVTGQVVADRLTNLTRSAQHIDGIWYCNCSRYRMIEADAGFSAYGSQMSQTIALKMVHVSLATAMSYLSVIWGVMSGYLVFGEVSNGATA